MNPDPVQFIAYVPERSGGAFLAFMRARPHIEWEQSQHQHSTQSVRVYIRSDLTEDDRRVLAESGVTVKHNSSFVLWGQP